MLRSARLMLRTSGMAWRVMRDAMTRGTRPVLPSQQPSPATPTGSTSRCFGWRPLLWIFVLVGTLSTLLFHEGVASAVPSFARKYNTSCQTCHTQFPVLNPFGEAFRRNGFRFPSTNGSLDSDAAKENTIPMGQEEYEKTFPNSVWPDRISETIPLSLLVQGSLNYVLPNSDLHAAQGNSFTWDGIAGPVSLFAAGAFSDRLTYYIKVVASPAQTIKLGAAFLAWNDLAGPSHLLNLWFGRLTAPQLISFGPNGSYVTDKALPAVSVAGLFNPNNSFVLGTAPVNGIEMNGIGAPRIAYSAGWLASTTQTGLITPNSEDVYVHVGAKFGGMSLDGEGAHGMQTANPVKPWAETSFTFDTFAYHGVTLADNGTNAPALAPQRSAVDAVGHALRLNLESFAISGLFEYQVHHRPYPGTPPTAANGTDIINPLPGVPDNRKGRGIIGASEISYVLFPWLIPAVRAEYTLLDSDWGKGSFLRVLPGVSLLFRPNIRIYVVGDIEHAYKLPPEAPGITNDWTAANGSVMPSPGSSKTEVEQVSANLSWAL